METLIENVIQYRHCNASAFAAMFPEVVALQWGITNSIHLHLNPPLELFGPHLI